MDAWIKKSKNIALIAHDMCKDDLIRWCLQHKKALSQHQLSATGTTGQLLEKELGLPITRFHSGPLGGDFQIGSLLVEGKIDLLIFFWDALGSLPHDPDVKALLRLATMWNVPVACNESSADFLISSPFFSGEYCRKLRVIDAYQNRRGQNYPG